MADNLPSFDEMKGLAQKKLPSFDEMKKLEQQKKAAADPSGESSFMDFMKSFPRGMVEGFAEAASAGGQAEAIQMSDPELQKEIPSPEGTTEALEKGVTGPLHKPTTKAGRVGETVGQFVGNPSSYVGPGGMARKAVQAGVSGLGSGVLGEMTKGTKLEPAARIAGGFLSGPGGAEQQKNLAALAKQMPNLEKYRAAKNAGYKHLEDSGAQINEEGIGELADHIRQNLKGFKKRTADNTFSTLEELEARGDSTISDLDQEIRQVFQRTPRMNNVDVEASRRAMAAFDDWLGEISPDHIKSGNPELDAAILKQAQGNYRVVRQLEDVQEAARIAQHKADVSGVGTNAINTKRAAIRSILDSEKRSRGMSDKVKAKMEEIVTGTWIHNRAREASKFGSASPVSSMPAILAMLSGHVELGAVLGAGGMLSRYMGEFLTNRQLGELEDLIKSEGPIGRPIARAQEAERNKLRAILKENAPSQAARTAAAGLGSEEEHRPLRIDVGAPKGTPAQ